MVRSDERLISLIRAADLKTGSEDGGGFADDLSPEEREFVRENELSLLLSEADVETPELSAHLEERERLLKAYRQLKPHLKEHDIAHAVIKFSSLPKPISDIDILIPEQPGMKDAFLEAGYLLENETEPHRKAFIKVVDKKQVTIDVHTSLSWRRISYLDEADVLEERVTRDLPDGTSVPVPTLEHDMLITAAHSMFDNSFVTLFEMIYANYLLTREDFDSQKAMAIADDYNWWNEYKRFTYLATATMRAVRSETEPPIPLDSFPYLFSFEDVVGFRLRKTLQDAIDGRKDTVFNELIGYPQDVLIYGFEKRLGISLFPVFMTITLAKKAIKRYLR